MSGWDLETQKEIPWNSWPRNGSKLNGLAQGKKLIAGNHVFFPIKIYMHTIGFFQCSDQF
jgi:hypothetical protein